jgi:hypothetical protein
MSWFKRWYGANPLHLLTMLGCFALAWYSGASLLHGKTVDVIVWFVGAVIGHDLILMPLYALADTSVMAVFRHRPPKLPTVPWINYLRVPVVLSGILLLIWFPLIFRIPSHFPRTTDLSLDPYLGHWLAVTGVLFLLSATALAFRLGKGRGGRKAPRHGGELADFPSRAAPGYPEQPQYPEEPWNPEQSRYPEQPWYPEPQYPEQPRYPERPPRYPERPFYPERPRYLERPPFPERPRQAPNEPNSAPPRWHRDG